MFNWTLNEISAHRASGSTGGRPMVSAGDLPLPRKLRAVRFGPTPIYVAADDTVRVIHPGRVPYASPKLGR